MRAIIFLLLVICMGAFSQAQDITQLKVQTIMMPIAQISEHPGIVKKQLPTVAGVFVLKNSRVKRALTFKTRQRDAKLV